MSNKENTISINKKTDEAIKTSVNERFIDSIDEDILFKIAKEVAEEAFKINHMKTSREINAENEAKKLVKAAIKEGLLESIDKDVLTKLSKEVAKEALFEILNKGKDWRFQNTKLLMLNYTLLKQHIINEKDEMKVIYDCMDENDIKIEYMWLESIIKSKGKTIQILKYVDEQLEYLKSKYENNKQYEKYRAFEMLIIENQNIIEIRSELHCGKNSPKKWSDEIIKELSVLLWGIEAIEM